MQTSLATSAACPRCAWTGPRLKRGSKLPAHKRQRTYRERTVAADGRATTSVTCDGPAVDLAIGRALGAAFHAAGTSPMPSPRLLTAMAPLGVFGTADLHAAAPTWARFIVTVHAPIAGPLQGSHPGARRTVVHYFADREIAESWAMECARLIGAAGVRSDVAGYAAVAGLDNRMKRWEALAKCHGHWSRREVGIDSPMVYLVIDPGGVIYRSHPASDYPGYGDEPARSLWDRTWS